PDDRRLDEDVEVRAEQLAAAAVRDPVVGERGYLSTRGAQPADGLEHRRPRHGDLRHPSHHLARVDDDAGSGAVDLEAGVELLEAQLAGLEAGPGTGGAR